MAFLLNSKTSFLFRRACTSFSQGPSLTCLPKRGVIFDEGMEGMPPKPEIPEKVEYLLPQMHKLNEKIYGFHRDFKIPRMDNRIDLYAKKLREMQLRSRYLPAQVEMVKCIRPRVPGDTMEKLRENKEVVVVIK